MECGGSGCGCGQDPEEYGDETDAGQNPGEYDQEGDMAKDELLTVIRSARRLIGMLDNADNMPEWTQKKITKSADYVDTAADYVASKKERGVMEQGVEEGEEQGIDNKYRRVARKMIQVYKTVPEVKAEVNASPEFYRAMVYVTGVITNPEKIDGTTQYDKIVDELESILSSDSEQGVAEGSGEPSPVARATLHRIMMRHPGMLAQHGPERVMKAVDDVADLVGDMDDIGSSDISGWVNMVQEILDSLDQDQGVAEGPNDGKEDNFTIDDIKNLERIRDLETLKAQAKELIKGKPARRMKPEKISWLYNHIDTLKNPLAVIKMMYDLMLAGEGNKVIGSRNSMSSNSYRSKFGEQDVAEGSLNEAATKASVSKLLRHIERHHPTWFDDYGMGEVEDTVVDMAEQGTFSGMTVVNAAALVGKELESMYGADAMSEAEYQGRKVPLGKPMKGDVAKSKVYVKDPKTGNVKKVNFGDPNMKIKKSNPARRKSFRARHNCDNPGPRTKARYWSCRAW
jgi:hypothetical protein